MKTQTWTFGIPRKRTLLGMRDACIRRLNRIIPELDAMQTRNPHLGLATGDGYDDTLRYRVLAMYESRLECLLKKTELRIVAQHNENMYRNHFNVFYGRGSCWRVDNAREET